MTRTGIEASSFQTFTPPDGAARSPERDCTQRLHAPPQTATAPDAAARGNEVTALAAYLAAAGHLAADAAARGDLRARPGDPDPGGASRFGVVGPLPFGAGRLCGSSSCTRAYLPS